MKRNLFALFLLVLILVFSGCSGVPSAKNIKMNNTTDSISCALGYIIASGTKQQFPQMFPFEDIDMKIIAKAFAKGKVLEDYSNYISESFGGFNTDIFSVAFINELAHGKSYFDEMSANMLLQNEYEKGQQQRQEEMFLKAEENLAKGTAFLEENGKRPEVITLESGLQYEILTKGEGLVPASTDNVNVHYHGTLLDGTVFDSSVERNEPFSFNAGGGVIAGWLEAIKLMPVGSKWKLFIPADLAYGEYGSGEKIGPNETLVFEVELLGIEKVE